MSVSKSTPKDWLFAALLGIAIAWICAVFDEEASMYSNKVEAQSKAHQNNAVIGGITYNKHGVKQP
jgi:hypothetical protein